jgi:threonine synthase
VASTLPKSSSRPGVLSRYAAYLPLTPNTPLIDLGEGSTPLVRSRHIGPSIGLDELYFKLESCNPTGSFKDRGMVVAVAKAMEEGNRAVLCASTGNTSASAAAYAAHCGLDAYVFLPKGRIAPGKLTQSIAYGARIIEIAGNFDDALRLAREFCDKHPVALVNSVNPHRIAGQKTAAFEIVDDLGESPDYLFIPVGNAGNITAYWAGFQEYAERGKASFRPKMMGFQAAGAAPIVLGRPVPDPQTVASAIRIGNPASWRGAVAARDESGGSIDTISDDEILDAYRRLAHEEGIFCEPASAASVAGLLKTAREQGGIGGSRCCVCVITGTGLKDPDTAARFTARSLSVGPSLSEIEAAIELPGDGAV